MRVLLFAKIIPSVLPASGLSVQSPRFMRAARSKSGKQLGAGEVGDGEEVTWGGHGEPIVVATSRLWKSDALYSPQPNSSRA